MVKILAIITVALVFVISSAFAADEMQQKTTPSVRDIVLHLHEEYIQLEDELKKVEERIRDFPHTTLYVSAAKKEKGLKLVAIELLDNNEPLRNHIYSQPENEALSAGARHQLYSGEIKEGSHNLTVRYFWVELDKALEKGETVISVKVATGKDAFIELSLERVENKVELRHSHHEFGAK